MELILVTPSMAKEWLEKSPQIVGRKLALTRKYVEMMRDGTWDSSIKEGPISFASGLLENGHSRCTAIVESNTEQWLWRV